MQVDLVERRGGRSRLCEGDARRGCRPDWNLSGQGWLQEDAGDDERENGRRGRRAWCCESRKQPGESLSDDGSNHWSSDNEHEPRRHQSRAILFSLTHADMTAGM